MNQQQIIKMIENNKITDLMVLDYHGNKLYDISEKTPRAAALELENILPEFTAYKRLEIKGKKGGENTPWSKGFAWNLEFDSTAVGKNISGPPVPIGSIGAMDYVNMFERMMNKQMELQNEINKSQMALSKNDPTQWIPLIQTVAPMLGFKTMAGPPAPGNATQANKELHFGDDFSKLSPKEISDKINECMFNLAKKVHARSMLKIAMAMDKNPLIGNQAENIAFLLNAINKNPAFLDQAVNFVSYSNK